MYIKGMTDAGIVEHYRSLKALAHNGAAVKTPRLGRILRELDITIAVARQRKVALPV